METEYKLSAVLNSQLKISGSTDPVRILEGAKHFSEAAGFEILGQVIVDGEGANRSDSYYDTTDETLASKRASLRIRRKLPFPEEAEVTLKVHQSRDLSTGELSREEISEFVAIKGLSPEAMHGSKVFEEAKDRFGIEKSLHLVAEILNRRSRLKLRHRDGLIVDLCFDRYYFVQGELYSEYMFEIEAEIEERPEGSDRGISALQKILDGIKAAFDFVSNPVSKVEQAKSWIRSSSFGAQNLYFLGLDIVGFTTLDSKSQLAAIQRVSKATKDILRKLNIERSDLASVITTGDGIVLGFNNFQASLLKVAVELIREVSERERYFYGVRIRVAIHYGMVFKFSDAAEGISLAGSGVNDLFRLLDLPESSQILVSSAAYEKFVFNDPQEKRYLHGPVERSVKHGQVVEFYNYFSERDFGRPL